jgi:hypothetical protein
MRQPDHGRAPGVRWAYFEDSRHIARWITAGRVQWQVSDDPLGVEYGVMGVRDRERAVNGQWIAGDWEHTISPDWWVRTEQGIAVYDTDHTAYRYRYGVGHRMSDRWEWTVEHGRGDEWETPQAIEQSISKSDVTFTSTSQWTDRLEHVASVGGRWYTDDNEAMVAYQEWMYRVSSEPLVTVGGGHAFDHYTEDPEDDAYYAPHDTHTGFGRVYASHRPNDSSEFTGEYTFSFNDDGSLAHGVYGHWDLRIVKDLWWQLWGRYFVDSARFGGGRYFEREVGSNLKWKF